MSTSFDEAMDAMMTSTGCLLTLEAALVAKRYLNQENDDETYA